MINFKTLFFGVLCLLKTTEGYSEILPNKPCEIAFPSFQENSCEGENCGRVAKIARRAFDVFEKADAKSKKIFTLKRGAILDEDPETLVVISKPGIVSVKSNSSEVDKGLSKNATKNTLYYYLHYVERGIYWACEGTKTFSVGEEDDPSFVKEVKKSQRTEWFRVKYQGKTGYVPRPSNSYDGLDSFGLPL